MAPSPDPQPTAPDSDEAQAAPRRSIWGAGWAKFSDNAIPTLVLGLFAGLMLFNLNETSDRITRVEDTITRLEESINTRFAAVDARLVRLEAEIDARFVRLEAEIDARFVRLEAEIDARFTKLEKNQKEIALTLARLVALFEAHDEGER